MGSCRLQLRLLCSLYRSKLSVLANGKPTAAAATFTNGPRRWVMGWVLTSSPAWAETKRNETKERTFCALTAHCVNYCWHRPARLSQRLANLLRLSLSASLPQSLHRPPPSVSHGRGAGSPLIEVPCTAAASAAAAGGLQDNRAHIIGGLQLHQPGSSFSSRAPASPDGLQPLQPASSFSSRPPASPASLQLDPAPASPAVLHLGSSFSSRAPAVPQHLQRPPAGLQAGSAVRRSKPAHCKPVFYHFHLFFPALRSLGLFGLEFLSGGAARHGVYGHTPLLACGALLG